MATITVIDIVGPGGTFTQTAEIPLTTIFTPPPDCTALSAYSTTPWAGGQWALQLDSAATQPTCNPSSYAVLQSELGSWYSPGVCPYSYNYVATSVQSVDTGDDVTLAVCCPPGLYSVGSTGWSCHQVLSTYSTLGSSSVLVRDSTTLFANPVSVAWRQQDLGLFNPPSAPAIALRSALSTVHTPVATFSPTAASLSPSASGSLSTSAFDSLGTTSTSSGVTSAAVTSTLAQSTSTSNASASGSGLNSSSGLSAGAAAGIGVGATFLALAIIGGLWWFLRRYKLTRREKAPAEKLAEAGPFYSTAKELPAKAVKVAEVHGQDASHEMDARQYAVELDGGWQVPEAGKGRRSWI